MWRPHIWVFLETEDMNLNYFLGKIPLMSQEGFELEETFKFYYDSNTEKESASVILLVSTENYSIL